MIAKLRPYPAYKDSGVEWLGDVPEHWEMRRLKGLTKILNGATPASGRSEYWGGDILWITPADLGRLQGRDIHCSRRSITRVGYESSGTMLAPVGSTVVSTRAPIGHLAILGREGCTNQGCRTLVPREDSLVPEWAYLGLLTARSELQALGQGATFAELSSDALGAFSLPLPPVPEQNAIVGFLDHAVRRIRRYIRAKKRLIELLEEQKQAIIHQVVTGQIDVRTGRPYLAYKDSGVAWLRGVPEHWEVFPLKYRARCSSGDQISVSDLSDTPRSENGLEIPVIGGNGRMGYSTAANVRVPAIAVGRVGALCGNVHVVEPPAWITDNALMLQVDQQTLELQYVAEALRLRNLNELANQSAQPLITGTQLRRQRIPIPPLSEQSAIVSFLDDTTTRMDSGISLVVRQIALVSEYRARLISDIVTGQLDVREVTASLVKVDTLDESLRRNPEARPDEIDSALA